MGRKSINYTIREIIFYRFVCNDTEIINTYVGSTIDLVKRRWGHHQSCNNSTNKKYNLKVYKVIRENGGWDAWKMIEIERRIVKDNQDAIRIEQEWIEFFHAKMNSYKAHRTEEEKKEYHKQYELENAERIKENRKQYRLEHAEQVKEKNKQYYLEHAEEKREYNKQYYLEHAERLNEQKKQYRLKKKAELNTTI
jgi:hypothetical protein